MKKTLLIVFCLSIVNCVSAVQNLCDVQLRSHEAVTPVDRADVKGWMDRHNAILERNKKGNVDLIMIGDSITKGWEGRGKTVWKEYYAKRNAVNMGFGGDRTQHVLWRLEHGEINDIDPKLAIILIGTNNSGSDNTAEQIADGVKAILCQVRTKLPNTKILLLGIFPRGSNEERRARNTDGTMNPQWEKNDKANKIISKFADRKMIYYMNLNKLFLRDGKVALGLTYDLLHPDTKGYEVWAKAMESMVVKLMGEKK